MNKNVVVAQSGGPSPVINSSLRGVVVPLEMPDKFGTVYAGYHGIEASSARNCWTSRPRAATRSRSSASPGGGGVGTCRYKLAEPDGRFRPGDRGL